MKIRNYLLILLLLAIFNCLIIKHLNSEMLLLSDYELLSINSEAVSNLYVDVCLDDIKTAAGKYEADVAEYVTVLMAANDYKLTKTALDTLNREQFVKLRNHMIYYDAKRFNELKMFYGGILSDITYFPVPKSQTRAEWVTFTNSWGYDRNYGGKRHHEGTDIMADINKAGLYPIISMCDGVVESIGWLELGGYRIGIRSNNGLYYYYAHLNSYADGIAEGSTVKAGQFLGFMGNTGYSKVEGTSGKFDVHLHMGIYYDVEGSEKAFNTYYILKNLVENVLYYSY